MTRPRPWIGVEHDGGSIGRFMTRRHWLMAGGVAVAGLATWQGTSHRVGGRVPVFVAAHQKYDSGLVATIRDGLRAIDVDPELLRGKRVLLKPNLVEPRRDRPYMTTHPELLAAAIEAFAAYGAHVTVGEAPGHVRDTEMAIHESGIASALQDTQTSFADLNYEPVRWFANRTRCSALRGFHLPHTVAEADLVVSLPKLKTHHWVGMTASMKNLYGILPGIKYGWPKNVLHHAGIPQTVVDIASCLPATLAIVDAIDCMEGDGPILGTPKAMGLILMGQSLAAVDATAARIMGLVPQRISYLQLAQGRLGPIAEHHIVQRGESWRAVQSDFRILDVPHLQHLPVRPPKRSATAP